MPKLKYSVAIPVKDYEDALKKVQKFVKRGFVDDVVWNNNSSYHRDCTHVVVSECGTIGIFNHSGYGTGAILERVRDVEQHYV